MSQRNIEIIGRLAGFLVLATGYVVGGALLFLGFLPALFVSTGLLWSSAALSGNDEWTEDAARARRYQAALRGFRIAARSFSLGVGGPTRRSSWIS